MSEKLEIIRAAVAKELSTAGVDTAPELIERTIMAAFKALLEEQPGKIPCAACGQLFDPNDAQDMAYHSIPFHGRP